MDADKPTHEDAGVFQRALAGMIGVIVRWPWTTLCLTLLTCAVCVFYTWTQLTYLTHRNDLISSNKDYLKRWRAFEEEFGADEDMVIVLKGNDRAKMERVLDELAGEIEKRPESFERLFYRVDLRPLHQRSLLFLPMEQIRHVQTHIKGMSLLLEPPVLGALDPWFGWRSLSIQQLMREGERRLETWRPGEDNADTVEFLKQLDAINRGAADYLENSKNYRNPWRRILPESKSGMSEEVLAKPQYFFSDDGRLAFLLVSPVKNDADDFTYARRSIDALRTLIEPLKERNPDVEFGLTGLPVLENDEMLASQSDSTFASWLALAGVALLYLVVYRGFRYPLTTVSALVVGTIWALGWLTLTVGHLNILSSAFAVMLIGMGDYGILWVTRFSQERQAGLDIPDAMRKTALCVGPSILTAALATAFSFFAAMLADLKAVSELGWIAGCGVLLCALSCYVVTPALLAIFDFRVHTPQRDDMILSLEDHQEARREWLGWLMRKPRWVFIASAIATLILAGFAFRINYDHNLLNLQAQHLESVKWEKTLINQMTGSSWYAVSWTTTPEEALALKAKYEALPEVSNVITAASLIPGEQERKLELLRDLRTRLRNLPKRGEMLEHATPSVREIEDTCKRIGRRIAALQKLHHDERLAHVQRGMHQLLARIHAESFDGAELSEPLPATSVSERLKRFEELMTRDLADDLHRLRDISTPTPIRIEDLPACLRERYLGKNGKWLVRIFSKDCLWNFEPLERFVAQVRTVDPEATGKPFTTLEGLKAMRDGFLWAGVYALIAMLFVLLLDFGKVKHTLVALLPLAMGMVATLGFMAIFGASLNPANMIAFPLILGVGADNGVHVLHDFRSRDRTRRYRLSHATGRGIMVAALTTILGFGTLMISQHQGMASLGLILTVGVTCCMATALVFLPALLYVMGGRKKQTTMALEERKAA